MTEGVEFERMEFWYDGKQAFAMTRSGTNVFDGSKAEIRILKGTFGSPKKDEVIRIIGELE